MTTVPDVATNDAVPPVAVLHRSGGARRALRPGLLLASAYLLLVLLAAIHPDLFAAHPDATDPISALQGPSGHHVFGTDQLGRDTFARVVHGARTSVAVGLGATALAFAVGAAWGLLAALGGRVLDEFLMRIADIFLSMPGTLMALLVVAVLGPSGRNIAIAIAVSLSPGFARVTRVQTLVVKEAGYVRAATSLGVRRLGVIARHVVPNVLPPLFVLATMNVGSCMIVGSSLSFLGLGPQPPAPEWGSMLSQARDYLQADWSLAVFPGIAITLTVICIGVVGRELQVRFEGRRS
ncbi:ABC transporter permease [Streptomyces sp. WI04-05B]|uniref:ABC transporter permease n=1 Tax=Streptomyces TaxID=1883 RepID=UPI00299FE6CD|nr:MULTISPECIES: ABC transporter permease [unclassified Streptomyces]MDX2548601.1 ABC transporter permease [Streptomyces sp. WI04-05B]MDX2588089.1 ABC transporter permease [Streptomyces sp. WI04-05A]MDX3751729.1 ABC transporter permease [Streptomyces sp. AK08-02]